MKPDKLEQFVINNSDAFDSHEPGDELWEGINSRVKPVRRINWQRAAWQTAAAIAIFLSSWIMNDLVQNGNEGELSVEDGQTEQVYNEQMQVLMEAEVYYASRIATAKEDVYRLSGKDERLMEVLNLDLGELEGAFEELKKDLKDDSDNQEVIEAMIQNYRIKLEILEEMLLQLNKSTNPDENTTGYEI